MRILIINGPNLNLLGIREPDVYGTTSFEEYLPTLRTKFAQAELTYFQSNHCGQIIDKIHDVKGNFDGVILNAGGYSHTSVSLGDAANTLSVPLVEVHISNIHAREPYRSNSYISRHSVAVICGAGLRGYDFAVELLLNGTSTPH